MEQSRPLGAEVTLGNDSDMRPKRLQPGPAQGKRTSWSFYTSGLAVAIFYSSKQTCEVGVAE